MVRSTESDGIRFIKSGFIRIFDAQQKDFPAGRFVFSAAILPLHSPVTVPEAANYVSFYLPEFAQLIVPYPQTVHVGQACQTGFAESGSLTDESLFCIVSRIEEMCDILRVRQYVRSQHLERHGEHERAPRPAGLREAGAGRRPGDAGIRDDGALSLRPVCGSIFQLNA